MHIKMNLNTKMLVYILTTSIIIFGATITFISINSRKMAKDDANKIADSYAREYANLVTANLNVDMDIARTLSHALSCYNEVPYNSRIKFYNDILWKVTEENPNFISVWANWELIARDTNWTLPYGRARFTFFRNQNNIITYYSDTLDRDGDNEEGAYYKMKVSKEETVMNPYPFSYTNRKEDEILETSVCAPILYNGDFVGLTGIDLSLDRFKDIIGSIKPFEGSYAMLLANNGAIVAHPNDEINGKIYSAIFPEESAEFMIIEKIQSGKNFSYSIVDNETDNEYYVSYAPIVIGKSIAPWSLAIISPVTKIMEKAMRNFRIAILVGLIGLIVLSIIIIIIARNISKPLRRTTNILKQLSRGNIKEELKIFINTNDEISEIADSVNKLIDGLNSTAKFAAEIGKGNLDANFDLLSDQDVLGNSLIDMRKSLINSENEEKNRKTEDDKQNWTTHGIAKFAEIQRNYNNDIVQLSFQLTSNLINYIDANQGAIYVLDDSDKNDVHFRLTAAIAHGRQKLLEKRYKFGESMIGRCAHERKTIFLLEIPEDYINITSGLGQSNPKCLLLVPLLLNDKVYGVIEFASFHKLEDYQVSFIEKLGESIASTISSVKVNEQTARLLGQAQQQGEELTSQEEEMRQNLEELQATQEESDRREMEMVGVINAMNNAILVMEYDMEGNISMINDGFLELYGIPRDKMLGNNYADFAVNDDFDIDKYNDLWNELRFGKTIKQTEKIESHGNAHWVRATYTPITDSEGNAYKVMNISINITESKLQEEEVRNLLNDSKENSKQLEEQEAVMTKNMEEISEEFEKKEIELSKQLEEANEEIEKLNQTIKSKE